ncbi:hypothetical protein [Promicromonospora kroppenstedtii]|uniref:hypothetical protein n=1 Tax=Promicromonospora kroppenstedtii TaxID=440482 RepID=UPI00055DC90D|nr:hypothetical protein [Promicromonospora kroppenstedtii]
MTSQMPPEGTEARCVFCREMVMLVPVPSGGWHWLHEGDPIDGQRHCLGGVRTAMRTLHKPGGFAWMYDASGYPLMPTGQRMP